MNFVLLGNDPAVLPLLRAIAAHKQHRLTHAATVTTLSADILQITPGVRLCEQWGELLPAESIDVVLVAGHQSETLEGAKQLAALVKALIVFPTAGQGYTWVYELSLIRDDTGVTLFPAFVQRLDPQVQTLHKMIVDGAIGTPLHLQLSRECHVAGSDDHAALLSTDAVNEALLLDVDLLRFAAGDYTRVTALYSGASQKGMALATTTLAGENLPEASWSVKPTADASNWNLRVTGEKGSLILRGNGDLSSPELTAEDIDQPAETTHTDFDPGTALLTQFEAALSDETIHPDWTDLTRSFEIVDGARRSIKRRRTIDLHFESTSERNLFKSQMTAIGCGLLSLTLLAMVGVLLAGTLLDPRENVEVRANRSNSIVYRHEFQNESAELTEAGLRHVTAIAERMSRESFPVLIEQNEDAADGRLDALRREAVVRLLSESNAPEAAQRTSIGPVVGARFQTIMQIARIVVFAPLALFLLLQLLLFIARPSADAPLQGGGA